MKKNGSSAPSKKRYGLLLVGFLGAWMFVLGVWVGRETFPVRFQVTSLEKKLGLLAREADQQALLKPKEDVYEELDKGNGEHALGGAGSLTSKPPPPKVLPGGSEVKKAVVKKAATKKQVLKKTAAKNTAPEKPALKPSGAYVVQVAALKDGAVARKFSEGLTGKKYAVRVVSARRGNGIWYRVRVGPYPTRAAAEKALKRLRRDKYDGFTLKLN